MRAERETSKRRGSSDRRGGRDGSARRRARPGAESGLARRTRSGRSAPAREARAPKSGPQTSPIARPVERPARPKSTSQAKARAKARKAKAPRLSVPA